MSETEPRISVIVAAYKSGAGIDRVLASLDAQTLPQAEFETIVVDDGSPDNTYARLRRLAAKRPNMRVARIPNSGWPSRPRNVATAMARGEYVLFMDHDDSLYPDALRAVTDYARATHADVVSPKESKTSDVWWGIPALLDGNVADAHTDGGIERLLPMVPHKVYRRAFLAEHGIAFPEGGRMLWEDIYVNVEAYRRARVVAALADAPFYLWHSSGTNSSKSYGPKAVEFWDRLEALFVFIAETLDGDAFADARRTMLVQQFRGRVLGRFSAMLPTATPDEVAMAMGRARRIQDAYAPAEWDEQLGPLAAARSVLLRAERPDLLRALYDEDRSVVHWATTEHAEWRGGALDLRIRSQWTLRDGTPLTFRQRGDRVLRILPPELDAALPESLLDVSGRLDELDLTIGLRGRADAVTWPVVPTVAARFEAVGADPGTATLVATATAAVDPSRAAAGGHPLADGLWDGYLLSRWLGTAKGAPLRFEAGPLPTIADGRAAIAYRSAARALTIDLGQRARTLVSDGAPDFGAVTGTVREFVLPLPAIRTAGAESVEAELVLSSSQPARRRRLTRASESPLPLRPLLAATAVRAIPGRIVVDGAGARLEGGAPTRAGTYRLQVRAGGRLNTTAWVITVDASGAIQATHSPEPPAPPSKLAPLIERAKSATRPIRTRLTRKT